MKQKALIQALGVTAYCSVVGVIFFNANKIFGKNPSYFGPVSFLLLLGFSVLVCGLLVFYQPYRLFFENKKKQAIDLVLYTTGWLFLCLLVFFSLAVFIK